jgi:F-type H+-transporting ATPase subunit delta
MYAKVEGYAAAGLLDLADDTCHAIAAELATLHTEVDTNGELSAALTDTSLAGAVRAAVLADLITGQLAAVTVDLACYAVRVAPAAEVITALSDLAHYTHVRTRDEPYVAAVLGHAQSRQRVAGFTDGILGKLDVAAFDQIEDDLFRWARTVEANVELGRVLADRDAPSAYRAGVVRGLLAGKVAAPTMAVALYVIEGGRTRDVVGTLDFVVDYVAQARNWRVARVWTAHTIATDDRERLTDALRAISGTPIDLQVVEQADLLGGVLVQIGDLRLDATTRGRLDILQETLTTDFADKTAALGRGSER